mmetsp:Transcript_23574/g.38736  ORF Transcript_23574/g.38736 Transcript_23574/m.38736 type:complete len:538 (+) Transcript_23574:2-1615(+)
MMLTYGARSKISRKLLYSAKHFAANANPKVYMASASSRRRLLFVDRGARLYRVEARTRLLIDSGSLEILERLPAQTQNSTQRPAADLIVCNGLSLPLIGLTICVAISPFHFVLHDPGSGLIYGVELSDDTEDGDVAVFLCLCMKYTSFSELQIDGEEADDEAQRSITARSITVSFPTENNKDGTFESSAANKIRSFGEHARNGLLRGAVKAGFGMKKGTLWISEKVRSNSSETRVPTEVLEHIKRARRFSDGILSKSRTALSTMNSAYKKAGHAVVRTTSRFRVSEVNPEMSMPDMMFPAATSPLGNSSSAPYGMYSGGSVSMPCTPRRTRSMPKEVGMALIESAISVFHGLKGATRIVFSDAGTSVTNIVEHRYGGQVGSAVKESLAMVGGMSVAGWNLASMVSVDCLEAGMSTAVEGMDHKFSMQTWTMGKVLVEDSIQVFSNLGLIWQIRWCVLKPNGVIVFPEDSCSRPDRLIPLEDIRFVRFGREEFTDKMLLNQFEIYTLDQVRHKLLFRDEELARIWLSTLVNAIYVLYC